MITVAPSVLGADFAKLADEIKSAQQAGIRFLHLDIMDGHFVPNISFGPSIVDTINNLTDSFLDVHLMLSQPQKYFEPFLKAGADNISFHLEVHPDPVPLAARLHEMGIKAGIAINPDMSVEKVLPFLKHFDYLIIMSVFPGFGGQSFIPETLPKIRTAKEYIALEGLSTIIEVDGGVDRKNAAEIASAGAEVLIMGTAFFGAKDRVGLVEEISSLSTRQIRK